MSLIDCLHDRSFSTLFNFIIVGLGGALGAVSRFGVRHMGMFNENPCYHTVAVNISGCFVIGILSALFNYWKFSPVWTYFCMVGLLGGYTTYSAFTLDTIELVHNGMWLKAFYYIGITLVGGLGGCALGLFGTERLLKSI